LHLLLSAVLRRRCCSAPGAADRDIACPPGPQQQTRRTARLQREMAQADVQTDGPGIVT